MHYFYRQLFHCQSHQDFAILRSLNLSQNQANFCKIFRRFWDKTRPVTSSQRALSQRKVVSQFQKWNEQPCVLIMPDLQELHWTNELKAERIRATRLGYSAWARTAGYSRSRDTVIHSAGRYSEESSRIHRRINNISVKSCEKHSNSAQNSVKATGIRTNATDVETRKNIVQ